ncbi:hypothetical protein pipiens_017661 [Culex pipiens pipiens]|uniref:Uncharacterized protein n=1 Tax=Culex pipiens pipiens TaxID=38569 RepID=A0ABD1CFH8_CULPP
MEHPKMLPTILCCFVEHLWFIEKEDDHYPIRSQQTVGQLYAGVYTCDSSRRYAFVWTQGNRIVEAPWEIIPIDDQKVLIRSKHLQEYLYAASPFYSDRVFTWRNKKYDVLKDQQFHWYIYDC